MANGIIKDENNIPKLIETLRELRSMDVEIGIFGDDDSHLLIIARVHEFGANIEVTEKMRKWFAWQGYPMRRDTTHVKIPERSYLRSGFDESEKALERYVNKLLASVMDFSITPMDFHERIGVWLVSKIQNKLRAIKNPPNTQMTIDRKGSSNPLIDDGRLIQSITYRVVQK